MKRKALQWTAIGKVGHEVPWKFHRAKVETEDVGMDQVDVKPLNVDGVFIYQAL
jgi:hypothetical protein